MIVKDKYYIGSTENIIVRIQRHKSNCYNKNTKEYNYKVYKYIRENCDDWSEVLFDILDVYDVISKEFRKEMEQYYMEYFSNNLNMIGAILDKNKLKFGLSKYHKKKVKCECGRIISIGARTLHLKSKVHQKLLNE